MNFQVPQFIEIEDKIFGPLTFKQFVYVAGGLGAAFIEWVYLPKFLAIFFIIPTVVITLGLAFYKVNNRPFILVLESALRYVMSHKLYIWQKQENVIPSTNTPPTTSKFTIPKLSKSQLKDLSWSLDIQEKVK